MQRKLLGQKGENQAKKHLQNNGYKILEQNFSCSFGEIDIIALHQNNLVFIEVKTRKSLEFGRPEQAVTPRKIQHIKRVGQYYKSLHPELPESLRIDVVSIIDTTPPKIKLFQNITR